MHSVSIVSPSTVLIDNEDQAVSSDNIVFAVETRGIRTVVLRMEYYSRVHRNMSVIDRKLNPSDCRRAALQEIVSTVFGILPLHRFIFVSYSNI